MIRKVIVKRVKTGKMTNYRAILEYHYKGNTTYEKNFSSSLIFN